MKQLKRIHLDRVEVSLLIAIVFLVSGMMFTLGVLVGFGIGEKSQHPEQHVSLDEHAAGVHSPEHGRAPASHEAKGSQQEAGQEIRKAFRASKQEALEGIESEYSAQQKPTSVADAETHFKLGEQSGRTPASIEKPVKKKELVVEKVANKPVVKQLFERSPSSAEAYAPMPGLFTIQIASYSTQDEASAKVRALQDAGFMDAFVIPIKTGSGDQWYRVGVGSYKSKDWAKKAGDRLVRRNLASDFIVRKVD